MSKATSNAHDWPCGEPDTYGWRGKACRKYPTAASEITTLREQVKKLEALVVMRCDLDVPPQFSQGLQSHEFLEPVTAEHCQWFVAEIEKLRKERDELHRAFNQPVPRSEWEKMQEQLAAAPTPPVSEDKDKIIAAANALENIASTSSSTRIRRVANDALTAIRARRK